MEYLGMDIGFGDVKAVLVNRELETMKAISFPTLVAGYTPAPLEKDKAVLCFGGKKYVAGQDARGEPGCFQLSDFDDMKEFAPLLFRKVLQTDGFEGNEIAVCAGMPPGWWPQRGEVANALRAEMQTVVVVPQGQGAFVAVQEEKDLEGVETVLILDFGYNTVDYLLMEITGYGEFEIIKGNTLPRLGVTKLVKLFRGELKGELSELPDRALKEMLRTGQGKLYGENINLSGHKRRAVEKYCAMLMGELKSNVGETWRETDAVICTGGGVYYFEPQRNLPHHRIVIPEEREFANARGQGIWIAKSAR